MIGADNSLTNTSQIALPPFDKVNNRTEFSLIRTVSLLSRSKGERVIENNQLLDTFIGVARLFDDAASSICRRIRFQNCLLCIVESIPLHCRLNLVFEDLETVFFERSPFERDFRSRETSERSCIFGKVFDVS